MRQDEVRDTGALLGTALGDIAEIARDVHRGLATRAFTLLGTPARPVQLMHDGISALAYGAARLGVRMIPAATGAAAAAAHDPAAESAHDDPRGRFVLGALNGFWGDRLATERASLAPEMRVRAHEGRLRLLPGNLLHDLAAAQHDVSGRIVVFVHGLCENDLSWRLGSERSWGEAGETFGSVLRTQDGWTPLYVNYNTGLHISDNGRRLSDLLDSLLADWPVPVDEISLVGHSMGGLVTRSAAHQAHEAGARWVRSLTHVVGLGAPHLGAPLERFVNRGTRRLARLPETRPLATWLNNRSVGIKDLRHGAVVEQDWFGFDTDDCEDHCTPATYVPGVSYYGVSATLSRNPTGPFAHDLLVQHTSAHGIGRTRRLEFGAERLYHMGGKHHFHLLNDRLVYSQLRVWLAAPAGAAEPPLVSELATGS